MLTSIGLMSGTSMDGIDAACIMTDGHIQIQSIDHIFIPYDAQYRCVLKAVEYGIRKHKGDMDEARRYEQEDILTAASSHFTLNTLSEYVKKIKTNLPRKTTSIIDTVILYSTYLHSLAVEALLQKMHRKPSDIDLVGYHGQTLFHKPAIGKSVIVGDGQYLAECLGIQVVSDFRSADIAHGGQGAPLAPIYHQALAKRDQYSPLAVVNCGGIANVTFINGEDLIAFDTGPGNGLIDTYVRQYTQGKEHMDENGRYGLKGRVDTSVLDALYTSGIHHDYGSYLALPPPKSLDIGDLVLVPELSCLSIEDACATLETFTARTIAESIQWAPRGEYSWVLVGGGWNNPKIRSTLEELVYPAKVYTANAIGWNGQAMEAELFAYLSVRSLQNQPFSFPSTTGVRHPVSGGKVYNS
jgi:anhydro-N-acetylmuramic acid kinase